MPDFLKMASEAEELAASVDSPSQRATFAAIAELWRKMHREQTSPPADETTPVAHQDEG